MSLTRLTRIVAGRFGGLLLLCWVLTGLHVFAAFLPHGSQAQPAADASYLLGPEDVVKVSVWKDEHLTQEVVVRPDGMISFPLVGDIHAGGKTVEDVRLELGKRLNKYVPSPFVSVMVTKILSGKIYVIGRVNKPGEFLVGHYTDVLQALSLAGGLNPFASENDIRVMRRIRGEQIVFQFRYGDVRKGKELDQNIILERGDVVVVP
ncbi:MAG: polysaccharide biosynthesis/export family protein [Chlorobia bacterium]|nr:polysaccharide biosynthesis/export family protein [Fimbriimonadaceae bacterium]